MSSQDYVHILDMLNHLALMTTAFQFICPNEHDSMQTTVLVMLILIDAIMTTGHGVFQSPPFCSSYLIHGHCYQFRQHHHLHCHYHHQVHDASQLGATCADE